MEFLITCRVNKIKEYITDTKQDLLTIKVLLKISEVYILEFKNLEIAYALQPKIQKEHLKTPLKSKKKSKQRHWRTRKWEKPKRMQTIILEEESKIQRKEVVL